MKRLLLCFWILLLAGSANAQYANERGLPPVDAEKLAERLVKSLQPSKGEQAVIVYDPAYYPEITYAVHRALIRAGVYPVLLLNFDSPEAVRALDAAGVSIRDQEEEMVEWLRPVVEDTDIFLWMPTRAFVGDLRWERLLEVSPARGIHFHWILPLAGRSAEEMQTLSRMYERAILETDYAALARGQDRLIAALRGRSVRVTSAAGTDLRFRVAPEAWFHKNDGDMSPARARAAASVRDREMEFPSGALRFIPDTESAEGTLAVPRLAIAGGVIEGLRLEFEAGRVARWQAEKGEALFRVVLESIGGDVDGIGEIVLGTNPLLVAELPSGELPYYGYGAGYFRVSLGDNWESGGSLRSPGGRPLWLFLAGATIEANGRVLVRDGKILPE